MRIDDKKVKEILIRGNYVTKEDVAESEKAIEGKSTTVVNYLLSRELISKDLLGQAIAEAYGVSYADLNSNEPTREQVLLIPEDVARQFRVVLFSVGEDSVTVTTDNPKQKSLRAILQEVLKQKKIVVTYSLPEDIEQNFVHYQKSLATRFSKIIEGDKRVAPEILEEIFNDAHTFHASDIHFEPQKKEILVRFRVDGVLHEAGRISREYYENILNRIKIQSKLRIDEHFAAQDGAMRHEAENASFDLRTSIVPTVEGEKIVLRVLAAYIEGLGLKDLGLPQQDEELLLQAASKPFGMILVTGPTGSGKTTTLYSVLKLLNKPDVNLTTIEDPVEYKIRGANQIQVNTETELTFAKGLRSIVRQDPDVVLVGEIRDEETAEIAVNAALTGQLMLSTFHANDAATAVPRLLDMNIEPFLLSSTLELIIAQRLIRKICDTCKYSVSVDPSALKGQLQVARPYFKEKKLTLYKGKGCQTCGHTGFRGRTAIFEFIRVTAPLQELILKNPSTAEIWALARNEGSRSLFESGIGRVKEGITTIEELLRVATPPKHESRNTTSTKKSKAKKTKRG